jgi:hypothetical protein
MRYEIMDEFWGALQVPSSEGLNKQLFGNMQLHHRQLHEAARQSSSY